MNKTEAIVTLSGVKKYFEDGNIHALDGVSLTIKRGEYVSIVGPSGSGKSTLLNLIAALDHPTAGTVVVDGITIDEHADKDAIRSRKIGFIFQLHNLLPHLSALENVMIPMHEVKGSRAEKEAKASGLLKLIGIGHLASKNPTKLSGGERQRVAIARTLANAPVIILGDEPTGDVDTRTGQEIMTILQKLNREQGVTLIVVTHAPEIAGQAQRIIEIRDGKIFHPDMKASHAQVR